MKLNKVALRSLERQVPYLALGKQYQSRVMSRFYVLVLAELSLLHLPTQNTDARIDCVLNWLVLVPHLHFRFRFHFHRFMLY